jgi:hypothetical protein
MGREQVPVPNVDGVDTSLQCRWLVVQKEVDRHT